MSINVKDITIGEGLPKVCVPIVEDNDEAILDKLKEFDQLDVDIIELVCYYYSVIRQYLCCCSIRPSGRSFISALPFRSNNP